MHLFHRNRHYCYCWCWCCRYRSREDGVKRVIKGLRPGTVTPAALTNFEHEISVMKQWTHPNLVLLYEGVYCAGVGMTLMDMDRAC